MKINFLPGTAAEGQYQDLTFHKRGGMGELYTCTDIESGEKMAVKIIYTNNDNDLKLFKTELEISESLNHENIVSTEYVGSHQYESVKFLYSVMPYYENGNLRDFIESRTEQISLKYAIELMLNLCNGLDYAHKKIVHRDLKPENILVADNDILKICDFGLSKHVDSKTRTHTLKGGGTLPYMAPECWLFEKNTPLMDIYSLGIIFFELLTLRLPFDGESEQEFRDKHLFESLPDINALRGDIPVKLVEVINKMTQKRSQNRYSTVAEIIVIIEELSENIFIHSESNIDQLANIASKKISMMEIEELKSQQQREAKENEKKFLTYSINSLFETFESRVKELNNELERQKISIKKTKNTLHASFMGNGVYLTFFQPEGIVDFINNEKQRYKQIQKTSGRHFYEPFGKLHLETNNVTLIGQASMNTSTSSDRPWGYNLVLSRVNEDDFYGQWEVVWFDGNPLMRKRPLREHVALHENEFYQEYEFGCSRALHTMKMGQNSLKAEGFDKLIEKLFQ